MKSSPFFSVIVPVYNIQKFIGRCIDSILQQTFLDFELLLVDDGSTDDSGLICDNYESSDDRIRVIHKQNGGVSSARNVGLSMSNGQYIGFVDADDYVSSDWLNNYYESLGDVDLVIQGFSTTGTTELVERGKFENCKLLPIDALDYLFQHNSVGYVWSKLFSADIIKKYDIKFDESMTFREDELFTLEYLKRSGKVAIIESSSYMYCNSDCITKYRDVNHIKILSNLYSSALFFDDGIHSYPDSLFNSLTSTLFDSYTNRILNNSSSLKLYKTICGNRLLKLHDLSLITKAVYLLPVPIAHFIFRQKYIFRNGNQ